MPELSLRGVFGDSQVKKRDDDFRGKVQHGQALGGKKQHDVRGTPGS